MRTLYITESSLVDIAISISSAGSSTAGEIYSLECSSTITGLTDQPMITWLDDGAMIASSDATRNVSKMSMNEGSYILQYSDIHSIGASDEGQFI